MTSKKSKFAPLQEIFDLLPGFIYQLKMSPDGKFSYLYISEGVERILGLPAEKVLENADSIMSLIHKDDIDRVVEESLKHAETLTAWHGAFRMHSVDGKEMYFEAQDSPKKLANGDIVWTGYANDVTEKRELERELNVMARKDSLTGMPNRIAFYEILENTLHLAKRKQHRFALMFVDLDSFKPVNDLYGHSVGDRVLHASAKRIRSAVRASDTTCRYGGDEFLVLLGEIGNLEDVTKVAKKIIAAIEAPFDINKQSIIISASIGITIYPDHGQTPDQLINNADKSMYLAKKQGHGNIMLFSPD